MGWCYTFGLRCSKGCDAPMLVGRGERMCRCESCGASCTGQFTNCDEIVFRPGGLDFQLRCLPDGLRQMYTAKFRPTSAIELGIHIARTTSPDAMAIESNPADTGSMPRGGDSVDKLPSSSQPSAQHPAATFAGGTIGPPPHLRAPAGVHSSAALYSNEGVARPSEVSRLRLELNRVLEATAAMNLAIAKLEGEVAQLRRDLTDLVAKLEGIAGGARHGAKQSESVPSIGLRGSPVYIKGRLAG